MSHRISPPAVSASVFASTPAQRSSHHRVAIASARRDSSGRRRALLAGLVGQLWTPGLLDRLQTPLSRIRE
ncbi:MAG TPA: hypothetical protein VGD81_05955 [Opitutaceae bacterium]